MNNLLLFISTNFVPLVLIGIIFLAALYLLFATKRSQWIVYLLLVWFPLESVVLRYTPINYFSLVKYFPEVLLYATLGFSVVRYVFNKNRHSLYNPVNRWFLVYIIIALVSLFLNDYKFTYWLAGMRQLLRFVAVFFFVIFENYHEEILRNLMKAALGVVVVEAAFGVVQYLSGGRLDSYLFFNQAFNAAGNLGDDGIDQFWAKGQRVFATLGRYDRLGSFLAMGFSMLFPWVYFVGDTRKKFWLKISLGLVALGLLLTYSRASWAAFILAVFVAGYYVFRDRRVLKVGSAAIFAVAAVLALVVVTRGFGAAAVDQANQSVLDRSLEAVSYYSWKESYEGYGRVFFMINTPLMVTRYYPFFGVGPGNYGSGAAAALGNDAFYSRLHLPFGIQNIYGQIDNNWWSILGETGLLGFLCWLGIFVELMLGGVYVFKNARDNFDKVFGGGYAGACAAVIIMGFWGPYFEFRASMFYFWMWSGMMVILWKKYKYRLNFLK